MRAYKTSDGMIEIFNCEPDEIITQEEFDKRVREAELDAEIAKTEKYLAELKAQRQGTTKVEDKSSEQTVSEAHTATSADKGLEVSKARRW